MNRPSKLWSSEEAYYQTGVWTAAGQHEPVEGNGGMLRSKPLFATDAKKRRKTHGDCTKHQYTSGALNPGILVRCGVSNSSAWSPFALCGNEWC
jgi:hypothetical protein